MQAYAALLTRRIDDGQSYRLKRWNRLVIMQCQCIERLAIWNSGNRIRERQVQVINSFNQSARMSSRTTKRSSAPQVCTCLRLCDSAELQLPPYLAQSKRCNVPGLWLDPQQYYLLPHWIGNWVYPPRTRQLQPARLAGDLAGLYVP